MGSIRFTFERVFGGEWLIFEIMFDSEGPGESLKIRQ